jgi:hypothetical protein
VGPLGACRPTPAWGAITGALFMRDQSAIGWLAKVLCNIHLVARRTGPRTKTQAKGYNDRQRTSHNLA